MSEAIKKDFIIAQGHLKELAVEQRQVQDTIAKREHEQRMAALTLKELSSLPQETPIYKTFGKAYLLSSVSNVQERLQAVGSTATIEKEKLLTRKGELGTLIASAEQNAKNLYEELQSFAAE